MTKETISTFLLIVNIGILPKSVKSKAANPEIKPLKISLLFLQLIRYHVIDSLMKLHVNHLRCLTFGYPVLVQCVVCLQFTPTVFSYDWIAFLKSASSFDFEQWKKKKPAENEEKSSSTVGLFIILDNVSSSGSWSPENWRLVHNQNRSVQTYHSFNQLISNHLKDIILDDIQTINFLPVCLYYMILSRSRSPKRRH